MSRQLHELIRSLSKSERRYFMLYCTREESGGNYLDLFSAISAQPVYMENRIKTTFQGAPFARQLHVTKNYLHKLILKCLRNYHAEISKDAELKDILRNVEILYNKELYPLCKKELQRAERIATTHELFTAQVEIAAWKRKLVQSLSPHDYPALASVVAAQKVAIDALQSNYEQWHTAVHIASGVYMQQQTVSVRNVRLKNPEQAPTLEGRVLQHNTQYLLDLRNDNRPLAEQRLIDVISMLEGHQERISEDPGLYVSSINNLLSFYVFQHRHDQALAFIQKVKAVYDTWKITASNRTLLKQILRTYNVELEIYRDTKSFDLKREFIAGTEKFISDNIQKIPKDYLVSFWFQLASIYFIRRNYSSALDWITRIIQARFKGIHTDLHVHALILNLMIHLEQRNLMVLRYFVDSTRRFLKRVGHKQAYTEVLLRFFIRIGGLPLLEHKNAYRDLRSALFPVDESSLIPQDAQGYIDFQMWIDSKLQ